MDSTELIYSDKLSLELFREGKRPTAIDKTVQGLLFINTKPTGSTKLAIRPKSGKFTLGEQVNQNNSATVSDKTNYLLFCNNIAIDDTDPDCTVKLTTTNKATLSGEFMLQKYGVLDKEERGVNSLLKQIELDPNLVVLYDHDVIDGYYNQVFISTQLMLGATNVFYIELDGMHINSRGENLIDALLNYGDGTGLIIDPYNTKAMADLITQNIATIVNRDNKPHTLYIRYTGADASILSQTTFENPLLVTNKVGSYQIDPDGLGVKITFAALHKAYPTLITWHQYNVGGDAIYGNRYVIEVNGVAYRDSRTVDNLISPTASLQSVVELNPALAALLKVNGGGLFNEFINLTSEYLDVKIYLDETSPYYQNNKTVDTGNNIAGLYKKLDYPYGTTLSDTAIRKAITPNDSVYIQVTNAGLSFRLGPNRD